MNFINLTSLPFKKKKSQLQVFLWTPVSSHSNPPLIDSYSSHTFSLVHPHLTFLTEPHPVGVTTRLPPCHPARVSREQSTVVKKLQRPLVCWVNQLSNRFSPVHQHFFSAFWPLSTSPPCHLPHIPSSSLLSFPQIIVRMFISSDFNLRILLFRRGATFTGLSEAKLWLKDLLASPPPYLFAFGFHSDGHGRVRLRAPETTVPSKQNSNNNENSTPLFFFFNWTSFFIVASALI